MKKELPRISDAEWDVMQVAWRRGDFTAQEMIDELSHRDWSPRTVKTLLGRLLQKGALAPRPAARPTSTGPRSSARTASARRASRSWTACSAGPLRRSSPISSSGAGSPTRTSRT
jgi:BlaI family penicillinase repressor